MLASNCVSVRIESSHRTLTVTNTTNDSYPREWRTSAYVAVFERYQVSEKSNPMLMITVLVKLK